MVALPALASSSLRTSFLVCRIIGNPVILGIAITTSMRHELPPFLSLLWWANVALLLGLQLLNMWWFFRVSPGAVPRNQAVQPSSRIMCCSAHQISAILVRFVISALVPPSPTKGKQLDAVVAASTSGGAGSPLGQSAQVPVGSQNSSSPSESGAPASKAERSRREVDAGLHKRK